MSLVVAALDKRVTGTVANYPAFSDVTGFHHNRAGGFPHFFRDPKDRDAARIATSAYYDAVNFAKRQHAPVSMAFGYNDRVCSATSMYAAYNVIPAAKELHLQLDMGHNSTAEFSEMFTRRIINMIQSR